MAAQIEVVDYRPEYRDAFRDINLEWVQEMFEVEAADRDVLSRYGKRYKRADVGMLFPL